MAKIGAAFPGGDTDRRRQWRGGWWVRFGLDYRPVPDATGDLERRIGATGVAFRRRIGGGTRRRSKLPRLGSVLDGCLACRTPAAARVRRCARLGAQARLARDIRRHCAAEGCGAGVDSPPASRTVLQRFRAIGAVAALPLVGGATFLGLFANANPLIGWAFSQIVLPDPWATIWRTLFGLCVLITIWASLRPSPYTTGPSRFGDRSIGTVFEPAVAQLTLLLVTFNTIFAVENGLDIVFLSSGAGVPSGVTMADYAHRGTYSLIVTAALAGVFVLLAFRPGSTAASLPLVRRLVTVWLVQNLLLVASSALRTLDYVDAYGMTVLRLSALHGWDSWPRAWR
ncbi:DUF4173 domain-containing protein [Sphingomonas sp. CFBP9021]|nr:MULTISPECIES: DUF4173 domain-containing protein [unclassified Sphingomonas]MDY0966881.1 DUF4173 domain-containing protein [Sphingomonas sp. CFBP9021]